MPEKTTRQAESINRAAEVKMDVAVELGRLRVPLEALLNCTEGSTFELDRVAGEPMDVRVNGKLFAKGEVVVVAGNYGVRLTEMKSS